MIARIWNGATKAQDAEAYRRYLLETGVKEYKKTEGNRGVVVLRKMRDERAEFTLISFWESYDAIKKFAGENFEEAVFYPDDEKFLVEKDLKVSLYDTLVCEMR